MINDREEADVAEETPASKPRITPVIVLSLLLGIMMAVVAVGSVLSYQRGKAVNAEMQALKMELKEKNRVHDDLQGQIEALSRQMAALKDYSIARSSATVRTREIPPETKAEVGADAMQIVPAVAVGASLASGDGKPPASVAAVKPAANPPAPELSKVKRSKPEGQSCELVGKSAEEQAAILKRCVGLMDTPKDAKGRK